MHRITEVRSTASRRSLVRPCGTLLSFPKLHTARSYPERQRDRPAEARQPDGVDNQPAQPLTSEPRATVPIPTLAQLRARDERRRPGSGWFSSESHFLCPHCLPFHWRRPRLCAPFNTSLEQASFA
jgi:hypothetical protein